MRSRLFELLVVNPRLLDLLVKTFDASQFAADLLVRRPHLLEEITRDRGLDQSAGVADHLSKLKAFSRTEAALDHVRSYRQTQLLRILLRDVLGLNDTASICRERSALAEACLIAVNRMLAGDELTIVALGKFGGEEISYGADLDVLFIAEEDRQAQKLLSAMAQPSAEGNLPRVDARLRPEGEQGPLVGSIDAYRRYYHGRAQLWELQALTRARAIIGPRRQEFIALAQEVWCEAGQHPDLLVKIDNMLERIRRERGTGSDFLDFKTGAGGMIEAEFLAQALQMRSGSWEPNWQRALSLLQYRDLISKTDATAIANAYDLLRHCEMVLRRFDSKSISSLPADPDEQAKLAKRVGYKEPGSFATEYRKARDTIHALYQRYIKRNGQSC